MFELLSFILGPLILGITYAAVVAYKKEIEVKINVKDKST
jgi:hypothetical protein